jgi:methionine biosynthesis protein MetW
MFYFSNSQRVGFDHISSVDYDAYWKDRGFALNKKLKEREEIMLREIPAGSSVMDIGCGNSLLATKLKEKNCDVSVGDISPLVLEAHKKNGLRTYTVNLEDTDSLKFDRKFDYIILSEVLEHTRNPEDILKKLRPYTTYFYLTIPNSAFYRFRLHLMFSGTFLRQWVHHPSEHLRYWSHIDFLSWLKSQGYKVIKAQASNGLDFGRLKMYTWWPNMFGHQICYLVTTAS